MGIILWIVFGALAGWLTSVIMNTDDQQGFGIDLLLGIGGAIVGGFIMTLFGQPGVTGFTIYSLIVAVVGASVVVFLGRMIRRI